MIIILICRAVFVEVCLLFSINTLTALIVSGLLEQEGEALPRLLLKHRTPGCARRASALPSSRCPGSFARCCRSSRTRTWVGGA
jgi:hypothetical protein